MQSAALPAAPLLNTAYITLRGHDVSPDVERVAKAICRETCAFMGELACWQITDDHGDKLLWPPELCSEPGCEALAMAAVAALFRP